MKNLEEIRQKRNLRNSSSLRDPFPSVRPSSRQESNPGIPPRISNNNPARTVSNLVTSRANTERNSRNESNSVTSRQTNRIQENRTNAPARGNLRDAPISNRLRKLNDNRKGISRRLFKFIINNFFLIITSTIKKIYIYYFLFFFPNYYLLFLNKVIDINDDSEESEYNYKASAKKR